MKALITMVLMALALTGCVTNTHHDWQRLQDGPMLCEGEIRTVKYKGREDCQMDVCMVGGERIGYRFREGFQCRVRIPAQSMAQMA